MTVNLQTTSSEGLSYQLIFSDKRRTVGLQVKQGRITVRAPSFVDQTFIDQFVVSKASWLKAKIAQQQKVELQTPRYQLLDGGRLIFLGKEYNIAVQSGQRNRIELSDSNRVITFTLRGLNLNSSAELTESTKASSSLSRKLELSRQLETRLDQWLKTQAIQYLPERLNYWSSVTNLVPQDLLIKKYKSRWGSCTSRGVVSLNSRLMLCPPNVIDYVIIHELCHLVHLNHSSPFWQLVQRYCSEMEQAKCWLKRNQREFYF